MNEILAFAVLSLGLLIPLGIFVVGAITTWLVVRRMQTRRAKWRAGVITALFFFLIPTWDVILGRAYFHYLCATEGGVRVYKRVELPEEYRDVQLPDAEWLYEKLSVANRYPIERKYEDDIAGPAVINRLYIAIHDSATRETLGTLISYAYLGGWLVNSTGLSGSSEHVPACGISKAGDFHDFLEAVFKHKQ